MAKAKEFIRPEGTEGKALAGVKPCGCITAAYSVSPPPGYGPVLEKQVSGFYAEMAKSGRSVQWLPIEEIREKLDSCRCGRLA